MVFFFLTDFNRGLIFRNYQKLVWDLSKYISISLWTPRYTYIGTQSEKLLKMLVIKIRMSENFRRMFVLFAQYYHNLVMRHLSEYFCAWWAELLFCVMCIFCFYLQGIIFVEICDEQGGKFGTKWAMKHGLFFKGSLLRRVVFE